MAGSVSGTEMTNAIGSARSEIETHVGRIVEALRTEMNTKFQTVGEGLDQVRSLREEVSTLTSQTSTVIDTIEVESQKFAVQVKSGQEQIKEHMEKFADQAKMMDDRAESFRKDGQKLESMLKDGIGRLETSQKDADEARRVQQVATDAAFDVRQRQIQQFVTNAKKEYDTSTDAIVTKIRQMDAQSGKVGSVGAGQAADPMQTSDAWQGARLGEARTEPPAEASAESRSGGRKGLCNWRDLEVKELATEVKREDFLLWRDKLGELLERSPGWSGVTPILEALKKSRLEATTASPRGLRGCR